MKYEISKVILDEAGEPAIDNEKPATFQKGIARALIADPVDNPQTGSRRPSADDKAKRYELFSKIATAPVEVPIDLSIDDIAVIKQAVDVYPTLIYGQIIKFLNQN